MDLMDVKTGRHFLIGRRIHTISCAVPKIHCCCWFLVFCFVSHEDSPEDINQVNFIAVLWISSQTRGWKFYKSNIWAYSIPRIYASILANTRDTSLSDSDANPTYFIFCLLMRSERYATEWYLDCIFLFFYKYSRWWRYAFIFPKGLHILLSRALILMIYRGRQSA